jgi:2-polyprenyl-3-methyl-5-hydroxy-6-metoxy-1,4-benzoquinol methylase
MFEAVMADLDLDPASAFLLHYTQGEEPDEAYPCLGIDAPEPLRGGVITELVSRIHALSQVALSRGGCLLVRFEGIPSNSSLASFRNILWPEFHVPAIYRFERGAPILRLDSGGGRNLKEGISVSSEGVVVLAVPRQEAMGPDAVVRKFDQNARGWSGNPDSPTYGHFRWMRRIMAHEAGSCAGKRVLDAGCGAGWVGIEAAHKGAVVSAFDPSPEMVNHARKNAESEGVELELEVGFGESPPFDTKFDIVISSGVVSFSPDHNRFFDGLDTALTDGGLLIVGDINPRSWGMSFRRMTRPVLPLRELNGLVRPEVIAMLEKRGYTILKRRYYQLTLPVPQLMHLSATRLGGVGSSLLLALNRVAYAMDAASGSFAGGLFDSYILVARKGVLSVA